MFAKNVEKKTKNQANSAHIAEQALQKTKKCIAQNAELKLKATHRSALLVETRLKNNNKKKKRLGKFQVFFIAQIIITPIMNKKFLYNLNIIGL